MARQLTGALMIDWVACFLLVCSSDVRFVDQASTSAEGTHLPLLVYALLFGMIV